MLSIIKVMIERKELLKLLINLENDLYKTIFDLKKYPWDSDEELVVLTNAHIIKVLDKYINGDIENGFVEDWANAIECRDDVNIASESASDVIFELANPLLTQPLSISRARQLELKLKNTK